MTLSWRIKNNGCVALKQVHVWRNDDFLTPESKEEKKLVKSFEDEFST